MRSWRALYLGLSLLSILGRVVADATIVVDGQDSSIRYITANSGDNSATWTVVQRSSDSCDTPQMLTSRVGDAMAFTFTGTGIFVVGTTGVKGGIIKFVLDNLNTTSFDRRGTSLSCDSVLFQYLNMEYKQHTIVATLVGKETNLQTGLLDGVLSIQRVRYTIPGNKTSSLRVWPAIGAILAFGVLNAASGFAFYLWRKKHPKRRSNTVLLDNDDDGEGKNLIQTRQGDRPTLPGPSETRKQQASQAIQRLLRFRR